MGIDIGARQPAKFLRNAQALNLQALRPNEVGFRLPPTEETAFSAGLSTSLDSVVTALAKKAGFGPILNKIKALVKPLWDNVLQKAIGNLPQSRPPAA